MFKKFYIVIFITIFCNGVIHSSPTKGNITELIPKEKQVTPVEVTDQPIHKVEPTTPVPQTETSTVKTLPNHTEEGKTIPKNSNAFDSKIISQDSGTKNGNTSVTDNKNLNSTSNNSNSITTFTPAADAHSTSTPTADAHTTSKPAADTHTATTLLTDNKTRTDVTSRNNWEMSRPIIAEQSTTPVTSPTAGTTTKAPVNKQTVVTSIPAVRTSTSSVHLEHNSPSPSQENGFDGASFVGGIVLTIGLTAIGFIAFKYYKSGKIDANYRTL